jgi:4-amino-4-deoxy-L-arabinose transferase-like glycosyltransferase
LRNEANRRNAMLLGVGLSIHMLTRPFESIFLWIAAAAFLLPEWRRFAKLAPIAALAVLPAIALTLFHAHAVTGSWTTIPYAESRYEYGVPTSFTFQPSPVPHHELTTEQRLTYEGQTAVHADEAETPFLDRWASRLRFYRFFLLAPLYLALPFFALRLRERRFMWLAATVLLFTLGTAFYPYFFPQYVAATAGLLVLAAIAGLERLSRISPGAARGLLYLAGAHFLFFYGLHAMGNDRIFVSMRHFESWDYVNFGDPEERVAIDRRLAQIPGNKLVFVRYGPQHQFHEWIHNAADIDRAPVVMALDLGWDNARLRQYYPGRSVWLLEPDAKPVRLKPYNDSDDSPFMDVER